MAKSRSGSAKKRKRAPAAPSASEDPEAFIRNVREEKAAELEKKPAGHRGRQSNDDLNTLTRLVSALISTNEEIWQRCKESMHTSERDGQTPLFFRVAVASIRVYSERGSTLSFSALPIIEQRHNLILPQTEDIPEKLTSVFAVSSREKSVKMPDYEKLFHSVLLLEDEVLIPFLTVLKDHLEDVQVRLGNVEAWLTEAEPWVAFLKELFPEFELPCVEDYSYMCCESCGEYLKTHPTLDYCESDTSRYNFESIAIKSIDESDCGHDECFDITSEKGRTKLKKFLDYIS